MSNASDFIIENGVLKKYVGPGGDVVIPEEVTCIGRWAFEKNFEVVSICFIGKVTRIEYRAFYNCGRLTDIHLPDSLESIGDRAFEGCTSLTSIHIGRNVMEIGEYAFADCTHLAGVWVDPENAVFCSDELGVLFEKNRTQLIMAPPTLSGEYAVPTNVETICHNAFSHCSKLQSVILPESVKIVERVCFSGCSSLKSVIFPKEMFEIGDYIFWKCDALEEVVMPEKIDKIGKSIISQCDNLRKLYYCSKFFGTLDSDVKDNIAIGWLSGVADYSDEQEKTIKKYIARTINRIFDKIAWDDGGATAKLLKCKDITLEQLEEWVGKCNDGRHPNMLAVLLDYKNQHFTEQTVEEYQDIKLKKELGIKERTLADWKKVFKFVKDTDGIRITGYKGTDEVVEIPKKINGTPVKYIGDKAFKGLDFITSVLLSNNITRIGKTAFGFCSGLKEITIPDSVREIDNCAFTGCCNLEKVSLPKRLREIGIDMFYDCNKLTEIIIPDTVEKISSAAFLRCQSLTVVTIPERVKEIGADAFVFCDHIKEIQIPDSVTKIGSNAFLGCSVLEMIEIPAGVKTIGGSSFDRCDALRKIIIKGIKTKIPYSIYDGNNVTIYAPAGSYAETYAKENNIPFVAE